MITKRLARSLGALFAAIGLCAGVALSAPPPPAHAATPTQLTNLRFSWMGGLLQNTQVKYVTVSLTLVDPDGIVPSGVTWYDGGLRCPCAVLEHVVHPLPNSRNFRTVRLHLASGTNKNGVWSGRFALGAADAGFWRPVVMAAGDIFGHNPTIPPPDDQMPAGVPAPWNQVTVNVRGYNWPRDWLGTPVKTGPVYVVRGGVGLTRSGTPVAGLRLEINRFCTEANQAGPGNGPAWPFKAVRTDTRGRYAYTVAPAQLCCGVCTAAVAYPTDTYDSFVIQSSIRGRG
jgi:hypothetical protein